MFAIVLTLAAAALTAATSGTAEKYTPETAHAAEQRLAQAGETLGAAWVCPEIDRQRLRAAMRKVEAMIDKGVDDNRQYYTAHNILDKGIEKGKRERDCRQAETALGDLEQQLGQ